MTRKKSTRQTNSGVRHVYWNGVRGKWYVRATKNGVMHSPGRYYDTKPEAAQAAKELRASLGIPENDQPFTR